MLYQNYNKMITKCDKFGCTPRINNYGVSWCVECGRLFAFNLNHKPINKNFTTIESKNNWDNFINSL